MPSSLLAALPRVGVPVRFGDLRLRVLSVRAVPLLPGRLARLRVEADEVLWGGVRLERAVLRAARARLRRRGVELTDLDLDVTLGQDSVDEMLAAGLPYARLELGADGVARALSRRRPGLGRVVLLPEIRDGSLVLRPQALTTAGGLRLPAPASVLPRLRIAPDVLLPGSRLTGVRVTEHALHLQAHIGSLQLPVQGDAPRGPEAVARHVDVDEQP